MDQLTRIGMLITGFVLRGLSTVCTGWLCYQLAEGDQAKWLAAGGGVFIQFGAFMALPLSVRWMMDKHFFKSLPGLVYSAVVFSVSTIAAVAFLEYGEQLQRGEISIDQTTQLYQEAAKADLKNGYRQRALETLNKVSDREQIENMAPTVASILAELYGVSIDRLRQLAWLVLAVLMDSGGVLCSVLPALGKGLKATDNKGKACSGTGEDRAEQPSKITEPSSLKSEHYRRGLSLIGDRCSGDEISIQDFKVLLKIGYPKARKLAEELEQNGILTRGGKSFLII